jgi:hypothetical protein
MSGRKLGIALTLGLSVFAARESTASAQQIQPPQDGSSEHTWGAVTSATAALSLATVAVMPRIFYSDPEVTVGWKARWHVSQLAPVLVLTSLSFVNEFALKNAVQAARPGCPLMDANGNQIPAFAGGTLNDDPGNPFGGCNTYGGPSTHAFAAFSGLGQGVGVFIFDTTKWSNGQINAGALVGDVAVPLILAGITAAGRIGGDWESTAQVLEGGGAGLVLGFLTGMTYALMQRPECGYTGSMICW